MYFTPRERQLIRYNQLQRSRFLAVNKTLDKELLVLKQKIELRRLQMIRTLAKTPIGASLGRDIYAINLNRTNYKEAVQVIRFFREAMMDIGLLSMPKLRGIRLTFAERKILMRILMKKRQFFDMVLTQHKNAREHAERTRPKLQPSVTQEVINKIRTLSMDRDMKARSIYHNSTKQAPQNVSNVDLSLYKWRMRISRAKLDVDIARNNGL